MARRCLGLCFSLALFGCFFAVSAQNTEFTYQGNLKDGVNPANGNFHFEFSLFDSLTLGNQIGTTIVMHTVPVNTGVFSVNLDFGNQFNGANRYLEIRVMPTIGGVLTQLTPRQLISNSPNALNANMLGGMPPAAYIQNTTTQQTNTNLNISGNAIFGGNVGVGTTTPSANLNVVGAQPPLPPNGNGINATPALDIVGATGGNTLNVNQVDKGGNGAGISIRGGDGGRNPMNANNDGNGGSITLQPGLARAPALNGNVLLAPNGGNILMPSATSKVGVGTIAPSATLTVVNPQPGITDPSPVNLPPVAIRGEATGATNSTIGVLGVANSIGGIGIIGLTNGTGDKGKGGDATAVLGLALSPTGETRGLSSQVTSPDGIALDMHITSGGTGNLIYASSGAAEEKGPSTTAFTVSSTGRVFANAGIWGKGFHLNSTNADLLENGDFITGGTVSANGVDTTSNITVGGQIFGNAGTLTIGSNMNINGTVTPMMLSGGDNHLCNLTGTTTLRFCSSSLRYKTNVQAFSRGLDLIRQLKPISFDWKENGLHDLGLGAEDVKKVEPRLTFDNPNGEVEGVKYSQLSAVLVNAIKEQQTQIEAQAKLINDQTKLLNKLTLEVKSLKKIVNAQRRHRR